VSGSGTVTGSVSGARFTVAGAGPGFGIGIGIGYGSGELRVINDVSGD
jgi:hypothetical protein